MINNCINIINIFYILNTRIKESVYLFVIKILIKLNMNDSYK